MRTLRPCASASTARSPSWRPSASRPASAQSRSAASSSSGKVAGPGLDDVLHLVARHPGSPGYRGRRAVGAGLSETLGAVHGVFQEVAVGAEEVDDGIAERGTGLGCIANVLIAKPASGKQRVAEHLPELGGDAPLVVLREALQIDVERLAELEQEGNRDGPLAALDQVQVARGDAELRRHARLGQPALAPEPADSLARHHLALHGPLLARIARCAPCARTRVYLIYNATAIHILNMNEIHVFFQCVMDILTPSRDIDVVLRCKTQGVARDAAEPEEGR